MKKYLLLTAIVMTLALPNASWSQTAPSAGAGGEPGTEFPPGAQIQQGGGEQHFQEHKAEILSRLNQHLTEVQQRIGCVQAATDRVALRACMPEKAQGQSTH